MADEECSNASKRRKIEETVSQILKSSDMEITTEFSVRAAAAELLGLDLSSLPHRRLVRKLIDSFLLSTATSILGTTPYSDSFKNDGEKSVRSEKQLQLSGGGVQLEGNYNGKVICKLSDHKRVTIHDINGSPVVAIRSFYIKNGNLLPRTGVNSGMSLTAKQWSTFRNNFPAIQEAAEKMQSRLSLYGTEAIATQSKTDMTSNSMEGSAAERNQNVPDTSNLTSAINPSMKRKQPETNTSTAIIASSSEEHILAEIKQEQPGVSQSIAISTSLEKIPIETKQTEADISTPATSLPTQSHHTVNAARPGQLVPIQTTRLDGKNYNSWRHQMEFFLNQLNIAYVLFEPCPEANSNEKVKTNGQRWINDDYMCRHSILNSLSDNLFQFYTQKSHSTARELWEELKLAYDEDFGTKRSQINKYIHFQMVDGVSVIGQVQELQNIANSIWASGTWIDENFHVSVIISKLPPSWKAFRVRLMREDFIPLNMLMHRIHVEEESRKGYKKETRFKKGGHVVVEPKVGIKKTENKRLCYNCCKEGHISKYCPDRSFEGGEKSGNEKESGVVNPHADANMVEAANTK